MSHIRLLWLPDKLRAWGLTVVEQPGWQTRGKPFPDAPKVAVGHHTATSARAPGDLPTLRILRDGRSDLPGPLCQVALSRSGVAHVIAAGKANHAGRGRWHGITSSSLTVGCEVEHPGTGPWTPEQLRAFDRVMAAMLDGLDQGAEFYCGHREWATPTGRKVDPGGVNLDQQRQRIRALLARGPRPEPTPEDDMPLTDADVKKVVAALKPVVEDVVRLALSGKDRRGTLTGHYSLEHVRDDLARLDVPRKDTP